MARIPRALITAMRNHGLNVIEVSGCWGRDNGNDSFAPVGTIAHATAGSRTARDADELRVILEGSNTAPPPISQFMLGRSGTWYFVADGRCNHVRNGWGGVHNGRGNGQLIGIEGCNDNRGEPWAAYRSYVLGVAVIHVFYGWPASLCGGHKEHQPGDKSDPSFDMNTFRADVHRKMIEVATGASQAPAQTKGADEVATVYAKGRGWAVVDAGHWRDIDDNDAVLTDTEQRAANTFAKVFGNAEELTPEQWDEMRGHYERTGRVLVGAPGATPPVEPRTEG